MVESGPKNPQPAFFSTQVTEARRFYLDLTPNPRKSFSVVSGGFERCADEYIIDRPTFPFLSLEFVYSGRGKLLLNRQEAELSTGSVFTYGPGVSQLITSNRDEPLRKYFVDFQGRQAVETLKSCNLKPGTIRRVAEPMEIQRVFEDVIRDGALGVRAAGELCDTLAKYLLLRIASSGECGGKELSPAFSTYLRCREHINKNFVRLHTLNQIAQAMHLDHAYLCRLFKRYDRETPHQMLTRLKMRRAAELLEDPDMLVKQAASQVGYEDTFHFSRIFKKVFGVSPKAFRRLRS